MKEIQIKSATKQEILDYFKDKLIGVHHISEGIENIPPGFYEKKFARVEDRVNESINGGSPFVSVRYEYIDKDKSIWKEMKEDFLIEDYADIKIAMEISWIDNLEERNRVLEAIKSLMEMELDAQERWNRILKVFESYKGIMIVS